jgi:hypothetical protein
VTTFPAGKDGKRQAMLTALAHDHPVLFGHVDDIAEMHDRRPELVDRLIKAAQLVAHGHVYADGKVLSQSSKDVYHVSFDGTPAAWHCTCEDFTNGIRRQAGLAKWGGVDTDYGLMCKHALASLLAYLTGIELTDEPIPF